MGFKRAHQEVAAEPKDTGKKPEKVLEGESKKKKAKTGSPDETFKGGDQFKSHNMRELEVPDEARPTVGKAYGGQHGFTVSASNGAVNWFV